MKVNRIILIVINIITISVRNTLTVNINKVPSNYRGHLDIHDNHELEHFLLHFKVKYHDNSISNILKPFLQLGYHGQPCCAAGTDYDDGLDDVVVDVKDDSDDGVGDR